MPTAKNNCQQISTAIANVMANFNNALKDKAQGGHGIVNLHINSGQLAIILANFHLSEGHTAILLDGTTRDCKRFIDLAAAWFSLFGVDSHWHLLADELSRQEKHGEISSDLTQTFHALLTKTQAQESRHFFVVPASQGFMQVPDPGTYTAAGLDFHTGERHSLQELLGTLIKIGYVRYDNTIEPGGLRVRGEQLDIKHPLWTGYYTVIFYGSTIESIVYHEGARSSTTARLHVPPNLFPDKSVSLSEVVKNFQIIRTSALSDYNGSSTVIYDAVHADLSFPWHNLTDPVINQKNCLVFYTNHDRVANYFEQRQPASLEFCHTPLAQFPINFASDGMEIISEAALFPASTAVAPISYKEGMTLIAHLTVGKPAVHSDHGIGIYEGLIERTINNQTGEYLVLRYAEGDMLSVPVEYAHKVTAYIGEKTPPLQRLGGAGWAKTKKQAQHDAAEFARELLTIASKRTATEREPYYIDSEIENSLDASFPYTLTPDQTQAWEDIKKSFAQPTPFDYLVVGDVGFGKTEIALRAARHIAANGKQVAILAPTTLLVQQHTDTLKKRFPELAGQIGTLSRFATPSEQASVREKISTGKLKIIIGTHALLSASTKWQDLGLVIIDEEQRFGVKHKEHFKKIRAGLDVISLSATPIPRTLSMALSGLKQLSVISTPPRGRKDVVTHVEQFSDNAIKEAVAEELKRGGQVYVVAPRVRELPTLAHLIQKLAPKASVAIIHGQLASRDIAKIMERFDNGETDILISSTIIENGIDLPNANTIIVTHATHFGLSDLYQLRGRIGRRDQQGHAYFLYHQRDLSFVQRQRLAAITEASHLGSGWLLAQRDLEIRGAGNLLGAEQSGTVNAVGIQLYLDMVQESYIKEDELDVQRRDIDIQLPIAALIPPHYINDAAQRTEIYQRLGRAGNPDLLAKEIHKVTDRYGAAPVELENLHSLLLLQHVAAKNRITHISSKTISPSDEDPYERLIVKGKDLPGILRKLGALGNWEVKNDTLTWNVASIDYSLLSKLVSALA